MLHTQPAFHATKQVGATAHAQRITGTPSTSPRWPSSRNASNSLPKVWGALGIGYTRFSDEGSNHRSLDQQLLNVLTKAQRKGVFVPWEYVCADAAVSGTIACRRGYTLAKILLEQSDALGITWFIVDDLSRLSRNTIESLKTGELESDAPRGRRDVVVPLHRTPKYELMLPGTDRRTARDRHPRPLTGFHVTVRTARVQPDQFRMVLLVIRPARPSLAEVPLADLSFFQGRPASFTGSGSLSDMTGQFLQPDVWGPVPESPQPRPRNGS